MVALGITVNMPCQKWKDRTNGRVQATAWCAAKMNDRSVFNGPVSRQLF